MISLLTSSEYSKAIREMVPIIDPEDDYLTIAAAEEQMATTHDMRQKDIHDAHAKSKSVSDLFGGCIPVCPLHLLIFCNLVPHGRDGTPFHDALCAITTATCRTVELARALEAARASATRPSTIPSAEEHAALMNDLDATRLSLAKAINDAESALAGKEAELARLKEETRTLELSDPAAEHELDATALRLAMYKGLGFEPIMDKDGRITKMLVRAESGDVHCVMFDQNKSDDELAQLLWKVASA
ncbi:hypothetical protein NUW54_g3008 [Trametes sanguinea]|uniref:Uncharacterized protein n=1 Tax=Trametes sanguinea TaxID=158606 RepID=A0ACC1Q543_9APHY|nr:hypothetical protein NUW54_g3008 [Trametes sanguinea]